MKLLVSIHDVAPPQMDAVATLWALCRANGVVPALLVVPDWHGHAPIERDAGFVGWLRAAAASGADIVLHGERHDEVGRPRRLRDAVRAWGRTAREGECLTLTPPELRDLVGRGLGRLRELGLRPTGFVPPAWLMRDDARAGAFDAGATFVEDAGAIHLPDGRMLSMPALRWSARTGVRAHGSVAVAWARWLGQRHLRAMRIALHPQDLSHRAVADSVRDHVARWVRGASITTYTQLAG